MGLGAGAGRRGDYGTWARVGPEPFIWGPSVHPAAIRPLLWALGSEEAQKGPGP
jgi:hypothetical protein